MKKLTILALLLLALFTNSLFACDGCIPPKPVTPKFKTMELRGMDEMLYHSKDLHKFSQKYPGYQVVKVDYTTYRWRASRPKGPSVGHTPSSRTYKLTLTLKKNGAKTVVLSLCRHYYTGRNGNTGRTVWTTAMIFGKGQPITLNPQKSPRLAFQGKPTKHALSPNTTMVISVLFQVSQHIPQALEIILPGLKYDNFRRSHLNSFRIAGVKINGSSISIRFENFSTKKDQGLPQMVLETNNSTPQGTTPFKMSVVQKGKTLFPAPKK